MPDLWAVSFTDRSLEHPYATAFFRNPDVWRFLQDRALPDLLTSKAASGDVRVWSAGCCTGQEAYTVAMVLCELLDMEAFRARVSIYATDAEDFPLRVARGASYPAAEAAPVPAAFRQRYMVRRGGHYRVHDFLRRRLTFRQHDLTRDLPLEGVDLLACRNVFASAIRPGEEGDLLVLHHALRQNGLLVLGETDSDAPPADLFKPVLVEHKIYERV